MDLGISSWLGIKDMGYPISLAGAQRRYGSHIWESKIGRTFLLHTLQTWFRWKKSTLWDWGSDNGRQGWWYFPFWMRSQRTPETVNCRPRSWQDYMTCASFWCTTCLLIYVVSECERTHQTPRAHWSFEQAYPAQNCSLGTHMNSLRKQKGFLVHLTVFVVLLCFSKEDALNWLEVPKKSKEQTHLIFDQSMFQLHVANQDISGSLVDNYIDDWVTIPMYTCTPC